MKLQIVSCKVKKSGDFAEVCYDNGEIDEIHIDLILKYGLSKGKTLNEQEISIIRNDNNLMLCKRKAYNFASYSFRTEKQIVDKLKILGYGVEIIEDTLLFLKKFDLIDDSRFAEQYIKSKLKTKAPSKVKLFNELSLKGIDKYIINDKITELYPDQLSDITAKKAAEKKLRMLEGKSPEKRKNSLINFLLGQGFDWSTIKATLEELDIK